MLTAPNNPLKRGHPADNSISFGGGSGMRPIAPSDRPALPDGPNLCDNCAYFNTTTFYQTPQCASGNVSRYFPTSTARVLQISMPRSRRAAGSISAKVNTPRKEEFILRFKF